MTRLTPQSPRHFPELTPDLSWTSIPGTRVGVAASGVRRHGRDDLVILLAPGAAAALITRSTAASAPCRWTRARVPGPVHAVVINAGNANAATGSQGERDTEATAREAARLLGCQAHEVLVCSTGVIGVPLPMDKILGGLQVAAGSMDAHAHQAARAILTTDLTLKEAGCSHEGLLVAGFAKGSGMIHPDMGTMLAFLVTDRAVAPEALQGLLAQVSERTFGAITVDGDTSTSDTVILQATGDPADPRLQVTPGTPAWRALEQALEAVCRSLARAIAADGEGAGRLLSVLVEGLEDDASARAAARAVARSSLVKCALTGADANWGRVVGALGAQRVPGLDRLDLDMGGVVVLRSGQPVPFDEAEAKTLLSEREILIHARFPGSGQGEAWGCDLTHGYVDINADYRS